MMDSKELRKLARFWESGLSQHRLLMAPSAIYLVEQTIKTLVEVADLWDSGELPDKLYPKKVSGPDTPD